MADTWAQSLLRMPYSALGYERDSDKEWADKQRQVALLDRLSKASAPLNPRIDAEVTAYKQGDLDHLKSPYHWRGVFAPGAPLYNAMAWYSSIPQIPVAASQRLANWVDPKGNPYPNAKKQFDSALNTVTMYGAEDRGWVPKGTPTVADVAENARELRGRRPEGFPPTAWDEVVSQAASKEAGDLQLSAADSLEAAGVPHAPAVIAGTAMDSVMDPWNGLGHAWRAARAGKSALFPLLGEFGTGQALVAPSYMGPALSRLLPEPPPPPEHYSSRAGDYIRQY